MPTTRRVGTAAKKIVTKTKTATRKGAATKAPAAKKAVTTTGTAATTTGTAAATAATPAGQHTEHEDMPWTIDIYDHPQRTDSPAFVLARNVMHDLTPSAGWYYGAGPYQDHHGGSLWVKDEQGWFMVKNLAGIEWSSQFCADPKKVDQLRLNAKRLYAKFPQSAPAFRALGFDLDTLLNTPITDAAGVSAWTDSICNAGIPLAAPVHTGVLPKTGPAQGGGVHHYPTPITDIQFFKHDDFALWATDAEGQPAAVVPVAPRGSADRRAEVVYATPGTKLHDQLIKTNASGERLILHAGHPLAKQAYRK